MSRFPLLVFCVCWVVFSLLLSVLVQAQGNTGSISGIVLDGQTKRPLGFATVFIAQTTFGVNSAENGTYALSGLPAGTHEVIASFVGYETTSQKVTLKAGERLTLNLTLPVKANALQEVVVRPDTNWRYNYSVFIKNFIGQTPNAAHTKITNPKALYFQFDPKESLLTAEASEPLIIENKALGYRIYFLLEDFYMDFQKNQVFHAGYPRYELMKPKGKGQAQKWEAARLKAYSGSLMHFMRALQSQTLEQDGFSVRRLERVPNPNRPPEKVIQQNINKWLHTSDSQLTGGSQAQRSKTTIVRSGSGTGRTIIASINPQDSLHYWRQMAGLPKIVQLLHSEPLTYAQMGHMDVMSGYFRLQFDDFLNVVYSREKEELAYVNQSAFGARRAPTFQTSLISLTAPSTLVEPNGLIHNPYSHFVEGYWGWEKMAETLPLDYVPPVNATSKAK